MQKKLAIIGIGNMAKAIVGGVVHSNIPISEIIVYDKNPSQYDSLPKELFEFSYASCVSEAIQNADCVLIAVKPQNYSNVLDEMKTVSDHASKLYVSIGAGITVESVSERLSGARVVRVLPNLPMVIGQGVSLVCRNPQILPADFEFVCDVFRSAGNVLVIAESEMNRMIGVTSSSPAYVFQFIDSIYQGALAQGLSDHDLLNAICDVVIGSAHLLKQSCESPKELIARVASKGGTTEKALEKLCEYRLEDTIREAMKACTDRAIELGAAQQDKK